VRRPALRAALAVAALLLSSGARLHAQNSWMWTHTWGLPELQGYFPRATGSAFVAADFSPRLWPDAVAGPYKAGVLDWPEVVHVRLHDGKVAYARPPALPKLVAGMRHQAILVEIAESDGSDKAFPLLARLDAHDGRVVRLAYLSGTPHLYLVEVSQPRPGASAFEIAFDDVAGKEIGRLPLALEAEPGGHVHVDVVDAATKKPTPARVGLYAGDALQFTGAADAFSIPVFQDTVTERSVRDPSWPVANHLAFACRGSFDADVPPGPIRLVVKKGTDWKLSDETFDVAAGETVTRSVALARAIDRAAEGWYSADDHVHVGRDGSNDADLLAWTQSEDVHVACTMQMGDPTRLDFLQFAWQEPGVAHAGNHLLLPGQEDPRSGVRGHSLCLWNAVTHWDSKRYLAYELAFDATHFDGGLSGYAHGASVYSGARGLALSLPLGKCDFIEVFNNCTLDLEGTYGAWNLGFRVTPTGGSDFPFGRQRTLGDSPFFVKVEGKFTAQNWVDGLRDGRTYVSNGPHVDFDVDGALPGDVVALPEGGPVQVHVRARVNATLDALKEIALVVGGDVVARKSAGAGEESELRFATTVDAPSSRWIAVRVEGRRTVAHTNAVYLQVAGEPSWRRDGLAARLAASEAKLDELRDAVAATFGPKEQEDALEPLLRAAHERYATLRALATKFAPSR
jgi:hypothetical protein